MSPNQIHSENISRHAFTSRFFLKERNSLAVNKLLLFNVCSLLSCLRTEKKQEKSSFQVCMRSVLSIGVQDPLLSSEQIQRAALLTVMSTQMPATFSWCILQNVVFNSVPGYLLIISTDFINDKDGAKKKSWKCHKCQIDKSSTLFLLWTVKLDIVVIRSRSQSKRASNSTCCFSCCCCKNYFRLTEGYWLYNKHNKLYWLLAAIIL